MLRLLLLSPRYPLSQPVRLTALPKGEPRGAAVSARQITICRAGSPPSHCRGGSHAARNVTKVSVPLNGIVSDIVRIRPTRFIFVDYTAWEATSLPYTGWAIVSAWYAKPLPSTAQKSRRIHQPGAHWGCELRFKYQFAQLCNGCGVRSPRNSKKISDTRMGIWCFRRRMRDSISLWSCRRPAGGKQQSTGLLH